MWPIEGVKRFSGFCFLRKGPRREERRGGGVYDYNKVSERENAVKFMENPFMP